eukprot:m.180089 g.180089  ORF g.180089 m.180089 type:complete len:82 (+) comp15491_c0_seq3:2798-3043(+)
MILVLAKEAIVEVEREAGVPFFFPDKVGDNKYDKLPLNGNGFFLTLGDWCRGPLGEGLECPLWFLLSFSGEFEKRPMIASY